MSGIINIGVSALTANQNALQTISNNIANVNTPGYTRQAVVLSNIPGQFTGSGYYGKGVETLTVRRLYDEFLTRQAATSQAVASSDATRYSYMQQLESLFPSGANGLGASVSDMLNAYSDITNAPTDLTARAVALARADEMAHRFRSTAEAINELRMGTTSQLKIDATAINNLAGQIAKTNEQIAIAQGSGHTPNDLLDQRDQLIRDLNKYVQTTNIKADDGSLSIFLAGSQPLVLGKTVSPVSVVEDEFGDPAKVKLAITVGGVPRILEESMLGGGEVAGLLRFQNTDLVDASNLLGRMALAIGTKMNEQQALGLDLNGNAGNPLFNLSPLPNGYASAANTGGSTLTVGIQANPSGTTAFLASNYEFSFATGTTGTITRLSDGVQTAFNFGATNPVLLDGLEIERIGLAANAGDRFVIAPYAAAARSINTAFSSPKELAMASPIAAQAGAGNTGALTLQGLATRTVPLPANVATAPAVTLRFIGPGQYIRSDDVDYTAPPAAVMVTATVYNYVPGQAIEANGRLTNLPFVPNAEWGWSLTLKGIPQAGDTYTVDANPYPLLDGANAKAMLDLRDLAMFDGGPLTDGYASLIAEIGTKVQGAEQASIVSGNIATNVEKDRTSVAGVNLDEEAARMIQYQQAYQAAGKMMQIAQNIFDTLLQSFSR
jgi:flagellar hook-associated protein 1 FlgK